MERIINKRKNGSKVSISDTQEITVIIEKDSEPLVKESNRIEKILKGLERTASLLKIDPPPHMKWGKRLRKNYKNYSRYIFSTIFLLISAILVALFGNSNSNILYFLSIISLSIMFCGYIIQIVHLNTRNAHWLIFNGIDCIFKAIILLILVFSKLRSYENIIFFIDPENRRQFFLETNKRIYLEKFITFLYLQSGGIILIFLGNSLKTLFFVGSLFSLLTGVGYVIMLLIFYFHLFFGFGFTILGQIFVITHIFAAFFLFFKAYKNFILNLISNVYIILNLCCLFFISFYLCAKAIDYEEFLYENLIPEFENIGANGISKLFSILVDILNKKLSPEYVELE